MYLAGLHWFFEYIGGQVRVYAIKEEVYVACWVWFSQRAKRMILLGYKGQVSRLCPCGHQNSE